MEVDALSLHGQTRLQDAWEGGLDARVLCPAPAGLSGLRIRNRNDMKTETAGLPALGPGGRDPSAWASAPHCGRLGWTLRLCLWSEAVSSRAELPQMLRERRPDRHARSQALPLSPLAPALLSHRLPGDVPIMCMSKPSHLRAPEAWRGAGTFRPHWWGGPGALLTVWLSSSFLSAGLSVWEAAFLLTQGEKTQISSSGFRTSSVGTQLVLEGSWGGGLTPVCPSPHLVCGNAR